MQFAYFLVAAVPWVPYILGCIKVHNFADDDDMISLFRVTRHSLRMNSKVSVYGAHHAILSHSFYTLSRCGRVSLLLLFRLHKRSMWWR